MKIIISIVVVWGILAITGALYARNLEMRYDPEGYAKRHQVVISESNYTFCDMWMVQVMPQFISPHGCN